MNKFLKYIPLLILIFNSTSTFSQEPINAMDHRLQQRPQRAKRYSESFFDNTFISAAFNASSIITPGYDTKYQMGPGGMLSIGKWFNASSGLRLSVEGNSYGLFKSKDSNRAAMLGLSADYLLNFNGFVYDDRAYRKFQLIGVFGASYIKSYALHQGSSDGYGARFGLQGLWNISPLFSIFIEPRFGLFSDGLDHADSWQSYDFKGDISVGMNYNYIMKSNGRHQDVFQRRPFLDNTFLSVGMGIEYLMSTRLRSIDNRRNPGPSAYLSVGKWFTSSSALRLTATAGYSQYNPSRYLSHLGGRLDYLLNLNALFAGRSDDRWFDLIAIAGINGDVSETIGSSNFTVGGGFGLQGNFSVSRFTSLYIEPRFNIYPNEFAGGLTHKRFDMLGQLAFGVIYNRTPKSMRSADLFTNNSFFNNLFVSAAGGGQFLVSTQLISAEHFATHMNPRFALSVGKYFTSLHGLRLSGSGSFLTYKNEKLRQRDKLVGLDLDYMLNITNMMAGYDEERIFDLSVLAGAGLVYCKGKDKDVRPSFNAGLHANFQVTPNWSLFVEPKVQAYHSNLSAHKVGLLKADPIVSVVGGMTYRLRQYDARANRRVHAENEYGNYFFDIAAGPSMVATPFVFKQNWGVGARASLGKWFTPISAWRTHLRFESISETPQSMLEYAGFEADYQLDITNLIAGYKPNRFFNLRAAAGFSLGASYSNKDLKFVPGLYASAQTSFRLNNALSLYLEPQVRFYNKDFARLSRSRRNDITLTGLMGMNYRFKQEMGAQRSRRLNPSEENITFVSVGIGTGVYGASAFSKDAKVRPTLVSSVAVGRWLTPVSAVQLAVNNSNVSMGVKPVPHFNFKTLGVEIGYITNWTALLTGTRDHIFNLNSILGLSMVNGWNKSKHAIVPGGSLGAQADFKLNKRFNLFVEPKVNIYSGKIDGVKAPVNVDMDLQLVFGTKYKF